MRAKRRTEQEQYEIIMECRQSGLSDHQWCLEHDINPGTFYNWRSFQTSQPIFMDRLLQKILQRSQNPLQQWNLQIGQAVLRISNQTDPKLLEQTLKLIGAFSC